MKIDPYNLQRFVDAQEPVYSQVLRELRDGQKRTHWMWFVFPQLAGLGHSAMALRYAIGSIEEARAYSAHAVLGPRLVECSRLVLETNVRAIGTMFPYPDDLKLFSCMTLFSHAGDDAIFRDVLARYFAGNEDFATLALLRGRKE